MKKNLGLLLIVSIFAACSNNQTPNNNGSNNTGNGSMQNSNYGQPSDSTITANVKSALMNETSLSTSARMVNVQTKNGVVTLTGTVPTADDVQSAERVANSVQGVQSVNNQLNVRK